MLPSGTGRHRRPRPTPAAVVSVATVAATGAGIALPLLGATAAHAADNGTWDKVAVCETGGLWSANTGDGFFGGLAITQATWDQYGGGTYAARPDLASRAQQITVAEKVLADLGPEAWPGCESGLLKDTATPSVNPGTPDPSGTLPGLPSGTLTPNPGASVPGGTGGSGGSATPGTPSGGATTAPGNGNGNANGGGNGNGNANGGNGGGPSSPAPGASTGTPAPGGTTAPPAAGIPGTGTPASPGTTTAPDPDAPPATADSGGRHGKPYSPTDEQLAAQDRATRTEVQATTTTGGDGTQGGTAGGPSGAAGGTGGNTGGKAGDSGAKGTSGTTDSSPASGSYTVVGGDSLSGIAGDRHLAGGWHALYDANRSVIGTDPNLIKPGQILNLG